ncbi:putative transcriptional regulator YheO [Nonomuraea thailandensis]|uniref:Transcriptional regulator YheO n=1 Tax=Nonomuraea thailandensis TaxID=1188745 RepID=A0A9X2GJF4_9ACTN|nr:PAS domain-containing protein [Nonomuraea thailandensis]MCP2359991.1 putative transcriptional regulator YheO [Nonomuraea thailandensis]
MAVAPEDGELTFTTGERAHAALVVDLLGPVVPVLAQALAPKTEVVLHNLTTMPNTIAAIGGTLTGRDIGGPPTDLGLRTFKAGWTDHLVGYRSETADGLVMRSSSIFFHAPSGKSVVCLCINTDIGDLLRAEAILRALTTTNEGAGPLLDARPGHPAETFPVSLESLGEGVLDDAVNAAGVPVELMKKPHKIAVVQDLNRRGFFTLRGAVELAAQRLNVSRFTIYNYLNELQTEPID